MCESPIAVSVVCNAYNHGLYIRKALDGFVMQKTSFPFEVLVHDDASTDDTAEIIREYEKRYPEIIKPIYETENQYSKRDGSLTRIQYSRVKGKYVALCEGDDYWTDPLKLQKQYDALEAHPQIDICATAAEKEQDGRIIGYIAPSTHDTIFTVREVICGGGGFVATASVMIRSEIRKNPSPFLKKMSMDYFVQIAGALRGGMLFLAEPMSVYRIQVPGSWTCRTYKSVAMINRHEEELCAALQCLDEDTAGVYHDIIEERIERFRFSIWVRNREYKNACQPEYKKHFAKLPVYKRLVIKIGVYFPQLADFVWKVGKKVR